MVEPLPALPEPPYAPEPVEPEPVVLPEPVVCGSCVEPVVPEPVVPLLPEDWAKANGAAPSIPTRTIFLMKPFIVSLSRRRPLG